MVRKRNSTCMEYDSIHGSRHGDHVCTCEIQQGHGKVHVCPHCKREWGHPDFTLKPTPTGI